MTSLLTAAERIQYEGYLRREEDNAAILSLAKDGATIKEIVRRIGHSRGLVRRILRGQRSDIFRAREHSLELYLPWLVARWAAGDRNGSALWWQLQKQGFRGCLRVVSEWATRRRRADRTDSALSRTPAARTIARMMTIGRDQLSKSETVTVAAIEDRVPLLVEAREIVASFQAMVRKRSLDVLDPWLERARSSLAASFANGVRKDRAAVAAAITSPWSNGQTEEQITKLKLVKRPSSVRLHVRCAVKVARPTLCGLSEGCPGGPGRASTHRGRAVKANGEVFVGIDTAKLRNAIAVAEGGRDGEVRYLGEFDNTPDAVAKLIRKLAGRFERVTVCYEAGPTGYGLYRQILALGHACMVVAPSLIPRRPGDRVKTNRRDAQTLARLLRAGELTAVWVPDETHEAVRDLVRARAIAVEDYRRKRQHVTLASART
jgi:hypothetical protein